jgi:cytochrome c oxidase subunit IV
MSGASRQQQIPWVGPALAWGALILLFLLSLGSAYVPLGAGNVVLNLLIAAVMAIVLAIFLMDLKHSRMLIRVVAVTGLFWTLIMFALTFSDYLSRG